MSALTPPSRRQHVSDFARQRVRRERLLEERRQALFLVAVGVAVGLIGALALTRVLRTLLTGISTSDPWVFALAPASMFAVAVVAALRPALRAAGVDPARALRAE